MFDIHSEFYFPKQFIISDDMYYYTYKDQLVEFCYEQEYLNPEGMHYSNIGGWQSDVNVFNSPEEYKYKFFKQRLYQNVRECFNDHFMIKDTYVPYIDRMWINISKYNDYNTEHTHPMAHFTGIFYVKCAEDCGDLCVNGYSNANDSQELLYRKPEIMHEYHMYPVTYFTPKEGRLLLFPTSLAHSVRMNKSNSDRISIAFDIVFKRSLKNNNG